MKKLFTTLVLAVGISFAATAQQNDPLYFNQAVFQSVNLGVTTITPGTGTTPGLSPSDSALPCGHPGLPVSDTIYFTNFNTFSVATVNSLKIDSLYLPAGLTWQTSHANNTFSNSENGVIYVSGTTNVNTGVYKLRIIVDVDATVIGTLRNKDAEALAGLRYHVRISDPACGCPAINKADSASVYTAYAVCSHVAITEVAANISDLSIVPNPMTGASSKVVFSAENEGTYTVKMTNLIGAVVSSKEVNITEGQNEITLNRAGLSSGLYLVSISNGKSAVTKKVIIE